MRPRGPRRRLKSHQPFGREWFRESALSSTPILPLRGGVYHCFLFINTPSPRRPGANPEP